MLSKILATFGAVFIIMVFTMAAAATIAMLGQWYMVQNQAQFVAMSMGKYGGYTAEADQSMWAYVNARNIDSTQIDVDVSNVMPVSWGTSVEATITYQYRVGLGSLIPELINVPLVGRGRAVSSHVPGLYQGVVYQEPSL